MQIKFPDSLHLSFKSALLLDKELSELNMILFSDHHRGTGDRADDFRFCSATYEHAINYYDKKNSTLILLGDVDELWENKVENVLEHYQRIISRELEFEESARFIRIYGNHDSDWKSRKFTMKHLRMDRPVQESVKIKINHNKKFLGYIYLIHGHQGSFFSDSHAQISKFFVRYFWRYFQQIFNKPLTTAASNTAMRSRHDRFYYQWARTHKDPVVVITGHTHEPVFNGLTYADRLKIDHAELTRKEDASLLTPEETQRLKEVRARLAALKKHDATHLNPTGFALPCYYNTGCCSFGDGEITGLEIMDKEIRLIKWTPSGERVVIQSEKLRRVMALVKPVG